MSDYTLGIIGGGNMGEALVRGVLRSGFLPSNKIIVAEPNPVRRAVFEAMGVATNEDNMAAACWPHLLLAIKPQRMLDMLAQIAPVVRDDVLVVTIAAGLPIASYSDALGGHDRIVRVMPNTPFLVGAGVSGICAGPGAAPVDVIWVASLCTGGGKVVVLEHEGLLDAVTAVSGSGPAYVFYLVEAMIAAGISEGLSDRQARILAAETCLGAGKMLESCDDDPAELRRRVTSPGGTTERAVEILDAGEVQERMIEAFRACAERSRELGK